MSRLHEFQELFNQIVLAWERGEQAVLVVLADVRGSAYRLPGTKMVMISDGQMYGTISGGCLESDLYEWAQKVFDTKTAMTHQYDLSENEIWSLGIGCKGNLEFVFLPIFPSDDFWNRTNELLVQEHAFTLIISMECNQTLLIEESGELFGDGSIPIEVIKQAKLITNRQTRAEIYEFNGKRYYIDTVKPSDQLVIAGAGQDAIPVVDLAKRAGFSVTVLDARSHLNHDKSFPNTDHLIKEPDQLDEGELHNCWWIIMNHHQEKDEAALKTALERNPCYIGVLGPIYRTNEMLANIGYRMGSGPIHSPVGLDIGAETSDEVAISIVSELMSVRAGRTPGFLHGKEKIHG